jgi:hypothetical protein
MTEGDEVTLSSGLAIDPVETLTDPQVKSYLLGILRSELAADVKYQRLLDLFRRERQIRERVSAFIMERVEAGTLGNLQGSMGEVIETAMRQLRIWDPGRIEGEVAGSIRKALQWLRTAQRNDGGWTIIGEEESVFWETAFSTLCLNAARELDDPKFDDVGIEAARLRGIEWLNRHTEGWFYGYRRGELLPVYNVALAMVCYYEIGPDRFGEAYTSGVREGAKRLIESRCRDGGWRARNWDVSANNDIESHTSEAGATSFALRACSAFLGKDGTNVIEEAADCLVRLMNIDGSWSGFEGQPSVTKTCDGVLGLVASMEFGVVKSEYSAAIDQAIVWLQNQEEPVVLDGLIEGWGWDYVPEEIDAKVFNEYILKRTADRRGKDFLNTVYSLDSSKGTYKLRTGMAEDDTARVMELFINCGYGYDYIGTCLTLEAMVGLKDPALPILTSNCRWLIENQARGEEPMECGKWGTNTARIALALIEYYRHLRKYSGPANV